MYARLARALNYKGYSSSLNDYSIFYKQSGDLISILAVYVDDILLIGNDATEIAYLRTDPSQGIFLSTYPSFDLLAFCDADWAACRDSRRSVSGFFIMFSGASISWKFKKQIFISLSSTKAEYRSMR
ncbi:PREDICTED: uncharacterized protein LOC109220228 [Nicotiana attenuata]|uniref:uncharacterized protein LOC109220228 n=1 Tax=Nicotiana attenuata TaxID=49451 RepID=UPI000904DBD2|nr:PREDICTED: uncharacterized protein LOC109220228 [Nicotiana attenuata]